MIDSSGKRGVFPVWNFTGLKKLLLSLLVTLTKRNPPRPEREKKINKGIGFGKKKPLLGFSGERVFGGIRRRMP